MKQLDSTAWEPLGQSITAYPQNKFLDLEKHRDLLFRPNHKRDRGVTYQTILHRPWREGAHFRWYSQNSVFEIHATGISYCQSFHTWPGTSRVLRIGRFWICIRLSFYYPSKRGLDSCPCRRWLIHGFFHPCARAATWPIHDDLWIKTNLKDELSHLSIAFLHGNVFIGASLGPWIGLVTLATLITLSKFPHE